MEQFPKSVEEARMVMSRAVRYRSGTDRCNSVYLGSIQYYSILRDLLPGKTMSQLYSPGCILQKAIDEVDEATLRRAWENESFQWILKHYRDNDSKLIRFTTTKTLY